MSGLRTIGGILALIAGIFILIQLIMYVEFFSYTWAINFAIGACALIGGVFGLKGQLGAGGVALVAGLLSIIMGIVCITTLNLYWIQYSLVTDSFHLGTAPNNLFYGISLEAILSAVGGVFILAGGSD